MATLALPIRELERSVSLEAEKARADTECVAKCSKSSRPDLRIGVKIAWKTLRLAIRFAVLVDRQDKFIALLVGQDLNTSDRKALAQLASFLEGLARKEREILDDAADLGAEIRLWWAPSLRKLTRQVDHIDSIIESLCVAVDPESTALLAFAVEQLAAQ